MGCDATDIGLTIHPHPTLSETVAFAAEAFEGTLTDLYLPKRPRKRSSERSFNVENPKVVGMVFGRCKRPLRTDSRGSFG
jgi:hypothetical protein